MVDIESRLDNWKKKLLDMSKRNPLLNYRDTRRSNLRIQKPGIYELWDSFVINDIPLEFPFEEDEAKVSLTKEKETEDFGAVQTNQPIKEQRLTLDNLRKKTKLFIEEQGVNILYLSFGFLRWTEADHSKVQLDSPLVLVPVSITRKSATSPFVLSLREDEISVNATLAYKLDNDFGIKLPEFEFKEELADYFTQIQQLITRNHWEIVLEVGLCLLSFHKINMYHDLEKHQQAILNHPIIRALGGDNSAVASDLSFITHFDHDRNSSPEHTFQIVDADASQQDAILCARKGYSFVLQGPPGTGKSQTITNIVAECLADGKKVLFVSEKAAALDVVYKRLKNAELDDFCLILHSDKENKKNTLAQLHRVLNLSGQSTSVREDAYQKLDRLNADRARLNEYSSALFTVIEPLHKTIYEVNGILADLSQYEDIVFPIEEIQQITQPTFTNYINTLDRFAAIAASMNNDYQSNPWYGTNIPFVSNELRSNTSAYLERLIPKVNRLSELSQAAASALDISVIPSCDTLARTAVILEVAGQAPKVPIHWLIDQEDISLWAEEIADLKATQRTFTELREAIRALHQDILQKDATADFSNFETLTTTNEIDAHIDAISTHLSSSQPCYAKWQGLSNPSTPRTLYIAASEKVGVYNIICQKISENYENEIFDIDFNALYLRFKAKSQSTFKAINPQYRADKKQIQNLSRRLGTTLTDEEIFDVLQQLRQMDEHRKWVDENEDSLQAIFGPLYQGKNTDFTELERLLDAYAHMQTCIEHLHELRSLIQQSKGKESQLQQHYGSLYSGLDTDWDTVQHALDWTKNFSETIEQSNGYGEAFFRNICNYDDKVEQCKLYSVQIKETLADIDPELSWFQNLFQIPDQWTAMPLSELTARLHRCANDLAALEEWIDFRTARSQCYELGLEDYIRQIETMHIDAKSIVPIFKKRFFRLWLDAVLPEYPVVASFRRKSQESVIQEFNQLDKLQFEIASTRIRAKLIANLPSMDDFTSGGDELGILKRELKKQRRIMPIRRLFREIPNLMLSLKPCLMMSPLSVSMFLEADAFAFDTVIFDEASQVCTENAIGSILRGKQVIIAGDSKQLPPTDFFSAMVSENDFDGEPGSDDNYDDIGAYDSILDEAEAASLPGRTLRWHYRSRHEHLIAFSNAKFYNGDLITFPSNVERAPNVGVEHIYVESGFYDRGGKKGNRIEADRVADLVFKHFEQFPNRSIGVIAFSVVQQQAIETALIKRRKEDQRYEALFGEDRDEAFFVKNLENVQGDERDTIIFSVGYAKDATGVMRQNFGPLNRVGGERRLNVAITRAKYNVKLVCSLHPTDIDIEKVTHEGPKLLRSYIEFAIHGPSALQNEVTESSNIQHDSPFEAAVYTFLERKGYKLATQVGCSGYRIDMAVKHPTLSGRYVLGIECDGASYHSARTARERDRLRQDVLESMGWRIHRIWSTDWIKDPRAEGQRLVDAVEDAINCYAEEGLEPVPPEPITPVAESEPSVSEPKPIISETETDQMTIWENDTSNPYDFDLPTETDFCVLPRIQSAYVSPIHYLGDCIELLVQNEWPIHHKLVLQKLKNYDSKDVYAALAHVNGRILRKGNFFYPAQFKDIPVRQAGERTIEQISHDELAAGMLLVLGKHAGLPQSALLAESIRAFGFSQDDPNVIEKLNMALKQLVSYGKIQGADDIFTVR